MREEYNVYSYRYDVDYSNILLYFHSFICMYVQQYVCTLCMYVYVHTAHTYMRIFYYTYDG